MRKREDSRMNGVRLCPGCFLIYLLLLPRASAQVTEVWAAYYDGPSNGIDAAQAIAADGAGNVYVTGISARAMGEDVGDFVTIKYDRDGNQLWTASHGGMLSDSTSAIAVDGSGNVYISGTIDVSGGPDYATLKYSPEGKELWAELFDGPGHGEDFAGGMVLDGSGNIYVTGASAATGDEGYDIVTIKYDPEGNRIWLARYDGPAGGRDFGRSIAIDPAGNIYVAGVSTGLDPRFEYAAVKYDPDGNRLWAARAAGGPYSPRIATDLAGDLHLAGSDYADYDDLLSFKYDADGNLLWRKESGGCIPLSIAVDGSGNLFIAGFDPYDRTLKLLKYDPVGGRIWERGSDVTTDDDSHVQMALDSAGNALIATVRSGDYLTLKYDAEGNKLWETGYDGPGSSYDGSTGIALDHLGNVHVTGVVISSGDDCDYGTLKYDPDGNLLLAARFNGPGNASDYASSMVLDEAGNIYVMGASVASQTSSDFATLKYDPDGNLLWKARYDGPGSTDDYPSAMAVDAQGNVYVTGSSYPEMIADTDFTTVKYDSGGALLWVARYDDPRNGNDYAVAIAVNKAGEVYITGSADGESGFNDFMTVKYDADGNRIWAIGYDGPDHGRDDASAMALDVAGNIYVTGPSSDPMTDVDFATIKYDPDGNRLWVARYNGPGIANDVAYNIALDQAGNIFVAGTSSNAVTSHFYGSAFVKYDPEGNRLWAATYAGEDMGQFTAIAIAADGTGNLIAAGKHWMPNGSYDFATLKLDPNGNRLWVSRYDAPGGGDDFPMAMALDASGSVYVTGYSHRIGNGYDFATVKYNSGGTPIWVERHDCGGQYENAPRAIAIDRNGEILVSGYQYRPGTSTDFVTLKYSPSLVSFIRGDCNGDGEVAGSLSDAVFLLDFNFTGGPAPPCLSACDANGDAQVIGQVSDALYLIQFNFLGGPAPPAPYPGCGFDPENQIGCEGFPKC